MVLILKPEGGDVPVASGGTSDVLFALCPLPQAARNPLPKSATTTPRAPGTSLAGSIAA